MSISSVKKKINAKTLLGQSSALKENSVTLKEGVKKLATILTEKKKIRPSTLMATEKPEVVEQKRIGPGKYDKPKGGGFLPFLPGPLLAGLAGLTGAFLLSPQVFSKRLLKSILKNVFGFIDTLRKSIKRVFDSIGGFFKKIFNGIFDNVKKLKNLVDDKLLKPLREAFESVINSKWFQKLRTFFDDITESIKGFVKRSAERFKTFADDVFTKIKTTVSDLVDSGIRAFKNILDKIAEKIIKPLIDNIKETVLKKIVKPVQKRVIKPITRLVKGIKSSVQDPKSAIRRVASLGVEKFTQLQDFGKGVSGQFKASIIDPIISGAQQIGQSAADIGRGFASNVGERLKQAKDLADKLNPIRVVRELPGKVSEIAGKIINPVKNAVVTPLTDIVSGGAKGLGNALAGIGGGLKKAGDTLGAVKGGLGSMVSFFDKLPLPKGVKNAFRKSTERFDRYFAIAEAASSYAMAVKKAKTGESTDIGPFKDMQGQMLGNAILTAAGGFLGSAIGTAAGSVIPFPFSGFFGTVIGGIIGEEFGKFAAGKVAGMLESNGIPNEDPFLSTEEEKLPIFNPNETNLIGMIESDGPAAIVKFFGFGGGGEEQPQGGFGNLPPKPVKMTRDFQSMEDYTEYITDTEVVIITKENVVNNVMQTPTVQQGKGGMIPVPIGSGESILDNFRSRALSQLAYN